MRMDKSEKAPSMPDARCTAGLDTHSTDEARLSTNFKT